MSEKSDFEIIDALGPYADGSHIVIGTNEKRDRIHLVHVDSQNRPISLKRFDNALKEIPVKIVEGTEKAGKELQKEAGL